MPRFNEVMVPERVQPFWAALQRGEFINDAAAEAGTYRKKGTRWVAACGGCVHVAAAILRAATCRSLSVRRSP
jgi:hypothetical protein